MVVIYAIGKFSLEGVSCLIRKLWAVFGPCYVFIASLNIKS